MVMLAFVLMMLMASQVYAQLWSGQLDSGRGTDWTTAGASITNRTTNCVTANCNTLWGGTVTATSIQNALNSASSGDVVRIPSGTYNVGGLSLTKSNVTLRGQGPNATKLVMTGTTACTYAALVCIWNGVGKANGPLSGPNMTTATWSAGYAKGTTVVTLSTVTGLSAGMQLLLDQLDDTATDNTEIWNCPDSTLSCMTEDVTDLGRSGRDSQAHWVTVVSISGSDVTITPALHMTYKSGRTPGAAWFSDTPIQNFGLENMTIDFHSSGSDNGNMGVLFDSAQNSWARNVRLLNDGGALAPRNMFGSIYSTHITIRDSYVYGDNSGGASQHYGFETLQSSDCLVENNIFEAVTGPLQSGQAEQGCVWAYNYALNDVYTSNTSWMQASNYNHAVGNNYNLHEGNDGIGFTCDAIHGPSFANTMFRNRFRGYDPEGGSVGGKTTQLVAVHLYRICRYFNVIGNVLGEPSIHTDYEGYPSTASDNTNPVADVAIYQLGWAGNQDGGGTSYNDLRVRETLYRWGNWDVDTNTARWCGNSGNTGWSTTCGSASEVPTGDSFYPQTVPASETLPNSFYLSARPSSWWKVGSTTPAWPPIGPDVTGGDMTAQNVGGHVYKIPARLCYESLTDDTNYTGSTVRQFDADSCYSSASAGSSTGGSMDVQDHSRDLILVRGR